LKFKRTTKNRFYSKKLKFCGIKDIDDVFPIYINQFVKKGNYDNFKNELVNKEFSNINDMIKILELRIEVHNLKNNKRNMVISFATIILSMAMALSILLTEKVYDTEPYAYIKGIVLIILACIIAFIIVLDCNRILPAYLKPIFYKHCIEILEEMKIEEEMI